MPRKTSKQKKKWSMYPSLHSDITDLLEEDGITFGFYGNDTDTGAIRDYDTNIMGRFNCYNSKCKSDGWSSKMIAIRIRLYSGNKYNARVYHQHCKTCKSISRPVLDASYAERVAYRLRKWKGIAQEVPDHSEESKGPHHTHLCEGCKDGHCTYLKRG
ncbi:hypothetical protein N7533_003317 [Penicillium manginii]|uniref:uncharacterized protein n=1 Tax=Penicillium manginii TaxID=203109 RepID=UPI002549B741|nr:uncharacterized protein N7533_003317 [Penicillium manginii]KAJ5764636.1 hypothetical protein N7533_003317 [Penicillium manginii]